MFLLLTSDWLATAQKFPAPVAYLNKIGQVWEFALTAPISYLNRRFAGPEIWKCKIASVQEFLIPSSTSLAGHHYTIKQAFKF